MLRKERAIYPVSIKLDRRDESEGKGGRGRVYGASGEVGREIKEGRRN